MRGVDIDSVVVVRIGCTRSRATQSLYLDSPVSVGSLRKRSSSATSLARRFMIDRQIIVLRPRRSRPVRAHRRRSFPAARTPAVRASTGCALASEFAVSAKSAGARARARARPRTIPRRAGGARAQRREFEFHENGSAPPERRSRNAM